MRLSILLTSSLLLLPFLSPAIDASFRYRSPRNPERKVRASTSLIVLHTTEAPARSSLMKVSDRGECHYCVTEEGQVYAIVDRDREAFHAGRSMWMGREDVDKFSIGIECVGYHDKCMPSIQIAAITRLVKELQTMYRIPDSCVVAHSHVAYGAPNKWHRCRHRGRKRCGMLFAMPSIRRRLGLKTRPAYDPDVRARRLVQADPYLSTVLYGSVDTMRGVSAPNPSSGGSVFLSWIRGRKATATTPSPKKPQIKAAPKPKPKAHVSAKPTKTKSTVKTPAATTSATKTAKAAKTTKPVVAKDARSPKTQAELKASGYKQVGVISPKNTAQKLAGAKWNAPTTYYTIRNKVIPGNKIDDAHIEKGMGVWLRK